MLMEVIRPITVERDWADFRAFAIKKHGSQMYGDLPYAYHLALVETILVEHGFSTHEHRAAGWLHDVVEDTDATVEFISELYGPKIATLVWACTGEGKNRKERNADICRKLQIYPEAIPIKLADRLANVSECVKKQDEGSDNKLEMYVKEWPEFKANILPLVEHDQKLFALFDAINQIMVTGEDPKEQTKTGQG